MRKTLFVFALVLVFAALAACAAPASPTAAPAATSAPAAPPTTQVPVDVTRAPQPTVPAPTATAVSKKGGDFKEVTTSDAKSFHPYQTTDTTSSSYQANVYGDATLTKRDPKTLQLGPGLAESWTVSDDAKTYTFKIRKDLKWSDGSPLTAQDFAWTFEQANNPANKYPYIDNFKEIVSYKALDDYTVQVVLSAGTCVGLSTADAVTPLPKAVWSKLDWNDPTKNPQIQNPSVVSGFFTLKEWKRDDHATFVRNDLFYRGGTNLDSDTVRIIPNTSVQFQMLKTGEVDYAPVSASDYAEAQKTDTLKEYDWDPAVATYDFLGFNLRRSHLQDVEVRHALSYAIPRQAITDKVFNGLAKPTYSAFTPTSWVYNPDVPHYDYSIETAKATLDKAGYKLDASGKLLGKDGKPYPKLKILFNTGNKQREQIATIAQEQFKQLGIDSEVTGLEFQAYLQYIQTAPFDYDLYVLGWRTTFEPYFSYQIWSESTIPSLNSGAYVNKDVEKLFDQSNLPPCDTESRKKPFQQIQKIISTDSPYIFLDFRTGYEFLTKRVVPNDPSPLGVSYFLEQWYLKAP